MAKIARAYVAKEADRERIAKATGLRVAAVIAAETNAPPRMRKGELLAVEDLTVFGDDRVKIAEAVKAVRAADADIIQIGSNRLCGDGAVMMAEALEKLWGMRRRGHPNLRKAALATAAKRTADGRCKPEKLFELWGGSKSHDEISLESGWPVSTIYRHFKALKITRAMARLEMENRRKAKRKVKR